MHGSSSTVRPGPTTPGSFPARLGSMPTIPTGGATMTTTRPDMRERQFVLGPEGVRVTILSTGAETGGRHDLTDSWLPAGSMTPRHLHTRYQERIWVASGSLTIWAGPDKVVLRSGDYHLIPTHVPHTIRSGPEHTHALHISTPAGFAELVARAGTPAHLLTSDTEPDLELFMAVTTELGDVVLGRPGDPAGRGRRVGSGDGRLPGDRAPGAAPVHRRRPGPPGRAGRRPQGDALRHRRAADLARGAPRRRPAGVP